ncbi:MAG: AlkA N-terminal domain-containing protein, partial [Myxococcota bacterium]
MRCAETDWRRALQFLSRRAIDGVEEIRERVYRRATHDGVVEIAHDAGRLRVVPAVHEGRVRRLFDLDTDADAIAARLAADPWLAPLVEAHGPLRVLGGWDGFELAVRAVMGQQVSVAGARTLNGRLVARCGVRDGERWR